MLSDDLKNIVTKLRTKILSMYEKEKSLSEELIKYKKENFQLKKEIGNQNKQIENLKHKLVTRTWSAQLSEEEQELLKNELDRYIDEIDSCIACINKQL